MHSKYSVNDCQLYKKSTMKIRFKESFLFIFLLAFSLSSFAQGTYSKQELVKGWHLLDKEKDGVYGISLDKAYDFLRLKNLKSKPVLVAVIDSENQSSINFHEQFGFEIVGNIKESGYKFERWLHSIIMQLILN